MPTDHAGNITKKTSESEKNPEDRIEKLDLSKWKEKERQFVLDLADVLTNPSPKRIQEHVDLARRAPSGIYDDFYLEMPSIYSLVIYGETGIRELLELGLEGEYWVPHILISVALSRWNEICGILRFTQAYLEDDAYENLQNSVISLSTQQHLPAYAESALTSIVHAFLSDPEQRHKLVAIFMSSKMAKRGDDGPSGIDIVLKAISRGTLRISEPICDELESLIAKNRPESECQQFFEKNPALIDPLASSIVDRQYLGAEWKTDFVIRRLDDEYIFVEIEKPQDQPCTGYPHPSGALSHAIGQILNWFVWIEDNIAYAQSHGFPGIHTPKGVVVIGRKAGMNSTQLRVLKSFNDNLYPRINIMTYDDVLLNARNILHNLTDGL